MNPQRFVALRRDFLSNSGEQARSRFRRRLSPRGVGLGSGERHPDLPYRGFDARFESVERRTQFPYISLRVQTEPLERVRRGDDRIDGIPRSAGSSA